MEYVYLICLLVAISMMVWLKLYDVRNSVSQYLSLTTIIISCFGYYFLEISRTLEEALFAQIIDYVRVAENVAHYHHEKINGTGYPEGLKGEEIPIEARIMALADVFDALVSKRCYKDAFSYERAYEIIEKDAGTHFDKQLAMVFLSCKEELERYYNASEK